MIIEMKIYYTYFILFLLNGLPKMSQSQTISGFWKSKDYSRVYQITEDSNRRFTAVIHHSNRKNDKKGDTILSNVLLDDKNVNYTGTIHSTIHTDRRFARIKVDQGRQVLHIKIPRFVIFPVNIHWHR